jgi:Protein of unknown function (DUF2809)
MNSILLVLNNRRSRSRVLYALAFLGAIGLGLASRRFPSPLSALLGKYPGDAIWAMMIFFAGGALRPKATTLQVATGAMLFCVFIEFFKLYPAPWMVAIRNSPIGHLIFGHVFSWENLVAYAIGVVLALLVEVFCFPKAPRRHPNSDL